MARATTIANLPKRPEVVSRVSTGVVATSSAEPRGPTADLEAVVTHYPARPVFDKVRQGIYLLSVLIPALIAFRVVLPVLGADPTSSFATFIYGITAPLVAPFADLFGAAPFTGTAPEPYALVA